jgi:hypothetical protein
MSLSSPRADNLAFMRDILVLIYNGEIKDQPSFDTYLSMNKEWKKSRRYHYLSGLRDLHFIKKENGKIELEEAGRNAVQVGVQNFGAMDGLSSQLSDEEKTVMKHHLLGYPPFEEFLSLFIGESKGLITDYSTFYNKAGTIGLEFYKEEENKKVAGSNKRELVLSGWRVIRPDDTIRSLSKTEKHATMWTLKYWAKSLELIDELWIPKFREYPNRFQKAMFPIKAMEEDISLEMFQGQLDTLIRGRNYISHYIPIPIVLYDFCTTYFVKVKMFLKLLCFLHFRLPGEYYLDKVSRAYIDERLHSIGKRKNPEGGYQRNYTNYPRIDDFYSSHLVVRNNRR